MYELPTSVTIADKEFNIRNKGDYRVILDCFDALNDIELDKRYRTITALIIFYEDINSIEDIEKLPDIEEAIDKMCRFFNCGQTESPGANVKQKLIDWNSDSQLIFAAVNKVANKEIRSEEYVHWYTFMGYFISIGKSTLADVVSIRSKIVHGKKLEKYETEFKNNNPQYFLWDARTIEQKEDDEWIRNIWNSDK